MRGFVNTILALIAFASVSSGLRAVLPWPEEFGLRDKLRYFEEHAGEFDALFIGSSRVFRDVMPRVIAEELAVDGIEFRAFNLGIGGAKDFETDYILRAALRERSERLQWVFIEPGRWSLPEKETSNDMARRTVEWHSLSNVRAIFEVIGASEIALDDQIEQATRHLGLWATRSVAPGRGRDLWNDLVSARRETRANTDGFLTPEELDADWGWKLKGAEGVPLEKESWSRQVSSIERNETKGTGAGRAILRTLPLAAIERQIEFVTSRVPNLVYLSLPNSKGPTMARAMASQGIFPAYWSYDLPSAYPSLFVFNRRVDANHLNLRGATELSKLIAEDLRGLLNRSQ